MNTVPSQTVDGERQGQDTVPVTMSDHVRERWAERTPADIPVGVAWNRAVDVEAPDADSTGARLYPPYNALLLVTHTSVTTILFNDGRINAPGLIDCPDCGDLVDPVDHDSCPWCGAECAGAMRPGCISLTRGDI